MTHVLLCVQVTFVSLLENNHAIKKIAIVFKVSLIFILTILLPSYEATCPCEVYLNIYQHATKNTKFRPARRT